MLLLGMNGYQQLDMGDRLKYLLRQAYCSKFVYIAQIQEPRSAKLTFRFQESTIINSSNFGKTFDKDGKSYNST